MTQKYINGPQEVQLLVEAATMANIPHAAEWVKAELDAAGVSVKLKGERAEYVGFTRSVFDKIAIGISQWELDNNPDQSDEEIMATATQQPGDDNGGSNDDRGAMADHQPQQALVELSDIFGDEPAVPAQASQPERVFDASKAIVSEDGEVLNEAECWTIAGMQPPATTDTPEDVARKIVRCVRHLQREVDDIAACAAQAIEQRTKAIARLESAYQPLIKEVFIPQLPKRSKSVKDPAGGFGVFFKKTGGWKMSDRDELAAWLDRQSDDVKAQCKATYKLSFRATDIYPHADTLKPPGLTRTPADDFGQVRIGAGDARTGWTPTKAKEKISSAMRALGISADAEDEPCEY